MKKIVAIFFLFIYGFTTVGATIHSHYCMGEYVSSSLYHTAKEKCGKCGMTKTKSKGCCKDGHKFVSLKRLHNQANQTHKLQTFFNQALPTPFINYNFSTTYYITADKQKNLIPLPPLIASVRLHILHCVFLIWFLAIQFITKYCLRSILLCSSVYYTQSN